MLFILIVLHKVRRSDSKAYRTLREAIQLQSKEDKVNLLIWNNSPECEVESESDFVGENSNLSMVYNKVFDSVIMDDQSCLMISDYDTDYSGVDFSLLLGTLAEFSCDNRFGVLVPQLYSRNRLVSPGSRLGFVGRRLTSVAQGLVPSKNFVAMNSGVVIKANCKPIMANLFNEKLRFYGTDTEFFVRYEKFFPFVYVLPFAFRHGLSDDENVPLLRQLHKIHQKAYGILHIFRRNVFVFVYLPYYLLKSYFLLILRIFRGGP